MSLTFSIIFCIIAIILGKKTERKILNPVSTFFGLWLLVLGLNSLQLFNIHSTDEKIYNLIFLGLGCYALGYYFTRTWSRKYRVVLRKQNVMINSEYAIRYNLLYFLSIITIALLALDAVETLKSVISGDGLAAIRSYAQTEGLATSKNKILNAINVLIAIPFSGAMQSILAVDFWVGKRDKKLIILDIIIILLRMTSSGGRATFIYLIINMIVVYSMMNIKGVLSFRNNRLDWKKMLRENRKKIIAIVIIGIIILLYTTLSRQSTIKTIYYYFAMEPYMFNRWADTVDNSGIVGYGLASINGFVFTLLYLIKNILSVNFPAHWSSIYELISATDSEWQIITSGGTRANAYVSLFWFFYLDGRWIGVAIGSFLYASLLAYSYSALVKRGNIRTLCIYSFLLQGLLFSFVRMQFSNIYYAISFVMICFFTFKRRNYGIDARNME